MSIRRSRILHRLTFGLLMAAAVGGLAASAQAQPWDHDRWRDHREWEHREWRDRHVYPGYAYGYYAPPPVYAPRYYAPPPVVYAPPPGIYLNFR
ncbi:MAG: hypothetical protein JO264_05865 [Acidisphaera sp.]|nr:hypothetical protein [Acidisphaera sp.]